MERTNAYRLSHFTCILCGPQFDQRYIKFPKKELRRKEWIAKCCIPEGSDVSYAHLCGKHFRTEDFSWTSVRRRLKNTAVPSLFLDKKSSSERETLTKDCAPVKRYCLLCRCKTTLTLYKFPTDVIEREKWIEHFNIDSARDVKYDRICEKHFDSTIYKPNRRKRSSRTFGINSVVTPPIEDIPVVIFCESVIEDATPVVFAGESVIKDATPVVLGDQVINDDTPVVSKDLDNSIQRTPGTPGVHARALQKKRVLPVPRYLNDIGTSHLSTPRRTKKCVQMTKNVIEKQASKIKVLESQLYRARARIKTLEDMVKTLGEENLLSEDFVETVLVY